MLDTEGVRIYDRANYSDYRNDQTARDPNVFFGERIQEGKEPIYEPSLACFSCCACNYDHGGTACAASGHCTDSIIRREGTGSRKGLDAATRTRWQAGPSGNMVQ